MNASLSKIKSITLTVLFAVMMFCIFGAVCGIPAWYSYPLSLLHLILLVAYWHNWIKKADEERAVEINNISLKKENVDLRRHSSNLMLKLNDHAKFNNDIDASLDVFSRVTGVQRPSVSVK